jgi:hypothetical protein
MRVRLMFLIVCAAGGIILLSGLAINVFSFIVGGWLEPISLVIGPALIFIGTVGYGICIYLSDR